MPQRQPQSGAPTAPAGLDALISMVADLGRKQEAFQTETARKLDAFRADWDKWRDEMPDDYPPRRELDQKLAVQDRLNIDHETRLRQIEAQLPSVRLDAFRETTATREQAMTATQTIERRQDDGRITDAARIQQWLVTGLITILCSVLTYLFTHPIH